jgi:hypothetical protein
MIFGAHRSGFSLINLLIVCSALGILISLAVNHTSFMNRSILRVELEKMYALFFYLQHLAIARNQQEVLTFDMATNSYCSDHHTERLPPGFKFGFLPHAFGPPSKPIKEITTSITFVDNKAFFYPDGTFSAGTIYMVDTDHMTMYALTSAVSPVSFIRKYRYVQSSWNPIP